MFKIQTLNAISSTGLKHFPEERYQVAEQHAEPDAILVRSYNMHEWAIPVSVKAVGRAGAGVNTIPVEKLTKLGIPVFNTPGANANAVRELVVAGMLMASRHLCQAWHYVSSLDVSEAALHHEIEQNKKRFAGFELLGKTVGVIGLGSIGVKVANAALDLGMRVIGFDPTITVNRAWELSSNVEQAHHLDQLLTQADFITLHVPLLPNTKNMIDAHAFKLMRPQTTLLNFARDGIVEQSALLAALDAHQLHAYVTDFPTLALKQHPRAICLPHLGASTKEAEENCAVMIVKQMRDYLERGTITHAVNFPTLEAPRQNAPLRLAIVNENVPNMVAQISAKLAQAGLNIVSLLNQSLAEIAYTLVDVNQTISRAVLQEIQGIRGVIHVREIDCGNLLSNQIG